MEQQVYAGGGAVDLSQMAQVGPETDGAVPVQPTRRRAATATVPPRRTHPADWVAVHHDKPCQVRRAMAKGADGPIRSRPFVERVGGAVGAPRGQEVSDG